MNRLAAERSPYLLQHANNPVDWFAWGDEAFAKADAENKPIFLSIGYSTCHWCHVMERESFENGDVAALLNERFVSIKVDREERPDVDRVYMAFVQVTTGSGGWPMSVWLTPDRKPFYGGTYFPPTSRWGRPGFMEILSEIARVWDAEHASVLESAGRIVSRLQDMDRAAPMQASPGREALARTAEQFRQAFDARHGGFGGAPKFPRPSELLFLLREHARTGQTDLRDMALRTLQAMALGGMRDHVGGGFHRYSVDAEWRVPHFEKMLYDQAQLVLAYAEAAQASGDEFFADVAEDTLRYVMREMTHEDGGFYSAEDADSVPPEMVGRPSAHKMEGAFYLWLADEVDALFREDAAIVKARFGIQPEGNAPADPQQEFVGKNLLYVAASVDELHRETGRDHKDIDELLRTARVVMFGERLKRPRPHLDDKILTAWNGLMVGAFARVSRLVRARAESTGSAGDGYLEAARRAARFIHERLWRQESSTLLRRWRDGEPAIDGYAEDYAFLINGLLELFQADPSPEWIDWALTLQRRQDELFWDEAEGGWFSTTGKDPSVLLRLKEDYDGAEPTASSVSVLNLQLLSHLVDEPCWHERIDRTLRLFGQRLSQMGRGVPMMGCALSAHEAGIMQVVVVAGGEGESDLERAVLRRHLPAAVVLVLDDRQRRAIERDVPLVAAMSPVGGAATAYVCRDFACRPPATTVEALERELSNREF